MSRTKLLPGFYSGRTVCIDNCEVGFSLCSVIVQHVLAAMMHFEGHFQRGPLSLVHRYGNDRVRLSLVNGWHCWLSSRSKSMGLHLLARIDDFQDDIQGWLDVATENSLLKGLESRRVPRVYVEIKKDGV